jgi:hypothetical protein
LTDTITLVNILRWDQRLAGFIKRIDKELQSYYEAIKLDIGTVKELESAVDLHGMQMLSRNNSPASSHQNSPGSSRPGTPSNSRPGTPSKGAGAATNPSKSSPKKTTY